MRRPTFGIAVGLLLLGAATAPAQLHFIQTSYNTGTVHTGRPLTREFDFVNAGAETVEIIDAKASCGCVKPQLSNRSIAPGARGNVAVDVNTLGQAAGPTTWGIQLTTQVGSKTETTTLRIDAELVAEVSAEPTALQLFTRDALTSRITLKDIRPKPLTVQAVLTTSPQLKAALQPGAMGADRVTVYAIDLEVTGDYPEGRHEEIVSIYTDDPMYRDLKMPVTIVKTARQRVTATPSGVVVAAAPGQPVPSRVIVLRDHDNQTVTVERILTDHPALSCSWAAGPGTMATLKVRVDWAKLAGRSLSSAVQVEVQQPVPQTLTIPVEIRLGKEP